MPPSRYGVKTLIILLISLSIIMTLCVLSACFISSMIIYLRTNEFIFTWSGDVLFSMKRGVIVGCIVGAGIWLLSRLKGQ
ncbi:immunity protein [Salmonella enterica subsp. enterica]|nr:immunity protein [Salmonella enterica subsp. enterica serovar Oranienburg]EGX3500192.1 immunity protein [Salmonella enterica]MLY17996.1 immunity protein [Salmonella enterica subsp. enterica serovar Oranienburg]